MLTTCHSQKESAEEDEYLGLKLGHSLDKLTANGIRTVFLSLAAISYIYRENKI
jgi:hypothetical protein